MKRILLKEEKELREFIRDESHAGELEILRRYHVYGLITKYGQAVEERCAKVADRANDGSEGGECFARGIAAAIRAK